MDGVIKVAKDQVFYLMYTLTEGQSTRPAPRSVLSLQYRGAVFESRSGDRDQTPSAGPATGTTEGPATVPASPLKFLQAMQPRQRNFCRLTLVLWYAGFWGYSR